MDGSDLQGLQEQVAELRSRVGSLEKIIWAEQPSDPKSEPWHPAVDPVVQPSSQTAAREAAAPLIQPTSDAVASAPLPASTSAAPVQYSGRSLENRIGSQWFNRIGILAVLIAVDCPSGNDACVGSRGPQVGLTEHTRKLMARDTQA